LWKRTLQEYIDTANDTIIVIAQIENQEGLDNCEAIAAVDGIGMLDDVCNFQRGVLAPATRL